MKAEVKRRRVVAPPSSQPRKRAWPRDALSIVVLQYRTKLSLSIDLSTVALVKAEAFAKLEVLRGFTPSADYFDEIRQFLPGIEVYPFAGRVQIGQTPVSFALNPYRVLVIWNQPAGLVIFRV
jgi:hypothetical protein